MSSELATVELPNNTNTLQAQTSTNINNNNTGTFQTSVNIIATKKEKIILPPLQHPQIKCPTFFETIPPPFDKTKLSLSIPVDLIKIKKNAINSLSKPKFNHLLQNPQLNELVDALISD